MGKFTHLHLHTEYSLLDGVAKIKPLVSKVAELGMDSCALTDHGVMYGAYEFWSACKDKGIKPIIGCEIYVAERTRHDKETGIDSQRYHLTLLAKNEIGYKNLMKIVSKAHTEGFYYKPRADKELLKQYSEGIICLSGCLASNFNRYLASGQKDKAIEWLQFLQANFDDVFVELQRNGIKESHDLLPIQVKIAEELGLPVVATCDVHYLEQEDHKVQEIAWCISDGKRLDDIDRRRYGSSEFFVKGSEEMTELFKDIPEAVSNTQVIADMVEEYSVSYDRVQPRFDPEMSADKTREVLRDHTFKGVERRYKEITGKVENRVEYELDVIDQKGYNDYFLVVEDYVKWAKDHGILVGPGRGSGAGSVVAYSLDITNLDPFKYNLIFERFLNPERPSPPDFDIDFQDDRRDELFEYVTNKYGHANTSHIGTFGRLKAKAAIRDVARAMGLDLAIADKLSKMVIVKFGRVHTIEKMREEVKEFDEIISSDPRLEELAWYVSKLDSIARHVSTHACGFLVTPTEITDYVPIQLESKGGDKYVTQFEGSEIEGLGLMKFDFLGLSNLTIISNALKHIEYATGEKMDIDAIPLDDEMTYKLFQDGDTTAVFQFESDGMKKYLRDLRPTEFEDLIFMSAAYRPGPMQYIPNYIERKFGREEVTYPHESLVNILQNTFGIAIYQEQVLEIAVVFAGYSLGEADILRRAMGKKKPEVMAVEKEKFIAKSALKGHSEELASKVFSYLEPFADYGFNRSHSAAYAMIAYQTAYLKAKFPVEFMTGLMETDLGTSEKLQRDLEEARKMGIKILPPDVSKSFYQFSKESDSEIRIGLGGIKGGSKKAMKAIVEERRANGEYANMDDLIARVGTHNIGKKDLELLIKVGAMDKFGSRNGLLAIMPQVFDMTAKRGEALMLGQMDLFADFGNESSTERRAVPATTIPILDQLPDLQIIQWEKEHLGVFVSSHPLNKYKWVHLDTKFTTIERVLKSPENSKVKMLVYVDTAKVIRTKTTNEPMSFLSLSDMTGNIEAVMFTSVHTKYFSELQEAVPIVISGSVSHRGDTPSILIDAVRSTEKLKPPKEVTIDITEIYEESTLSELKQHIKPEGQIDVVIIYGEKIQPKRIRRMIDLAPDTIDTISPYIKVS